MDTTTSELRFGAARLDVERRQLMIDGQPAKLGARAFDLLLVLVERRDRAVDKNELFQLVWPGVVVEENNLQVHISTLRKLLGPQTITTIPGRGYRFTAGLDTPATSDTLTAPSTAAVPLVERDAAMQLLEDRLRSVARGTGHTVLIGGEAGLGKTSVLKTLAERRGEAHLWWGACVALQVPHPLAPLHDIARSSEVAFRSLLSTDASRAALFEAVLTELQQARRPTLVVIEDVHWADDATLDFLKFLGRRIDRAACLLAISYRDDELTPAHPLRSLLGELPSSLVTRVDLHRLSPAAVELLARSALRSPAGVYAATQGNPFFVTELLTHGTTDVPRSVQDLVLARFARLSLGAQAIVKLASIVPAKIERSLVEKLLQPNVALVEECLNSGLLTTATSALCFRHELARVAIETSLSEPVAQALHADVLDALVREDKTLVSLARLVHHATRSGDAPAVCRFAPAAAEQASARGAHREAAAHWRTAMAHAHTVEDETRARWLEACADECALVGRLGEAIDAREQLAQLLHRLGDTACEGHNLTRLSNLYVGALRNTESDAMSRRAIALLEALPPGVELARAYHGEAWLRMLNRDCEDSVQWARKAIVVAEALGDRAVLAGARAVLGTALMFIDYQAGCEQMMQALQMAREQGLYSVVAVTLGNLGSGSGELFRFVAAEAWLREGILFADSHELDGSALYATAWLALCELHRGRWDDTAAHASEVMARADISSITKVMALVALGRLRARRGDPGVAEALDEALELALASNTLQRIAPVRAARAEAAYLRGDLRAVAEEAQAALALATDHRHPWFIGELAYWLHRAGALDVVPEPCAEPFALQIRGRWREAAAAWANLGCPYEQARALSEGDSEAQLEALNLFEQLGARPAAERLRQQLRAAGLRGAPRGMRPSTQTNPHKLTAREIEVLLLLCEGLKNSEIAERLCRSVRTVDHHLAAVFTKLGVTTRTEAVAAALHAGIRRQNGQDIKAI